MIHQELKKHPHHYTLLLIGEALLLSLFLSLDDQTLKMLVAIIVGVFYFIWGVVVHSKEIRPKRLLLEYAVVGLMSSLILLILVKNM